MTFFNIPSSDKSFSGSFCSLRFCEAKFKQVRSLLLDVGVFEATSELCLVVTADPSLDSPKHEIVYN
jgi:hypothetical protein